MSKTINTLLMIVIASFVTGTLLYPYMPDIMASHRGIQGQVDGYMPKFWALFLMPLISTGLLALFIYVPRIDPLKKNIEKFRKYYDNFIKIIFIFLYYLYSLTLIWNLGITYNIITALLPAFTTLFYYTGIMIENAKQNWFIGIRTPWTLSNEKVWNKTHKLGGKLFKIASVIILLGLVLNDYAFIILLVTVLTATIYIIVYSYTEYRKIINHE